MEEEITPPAKSGTCPPVALPDAYRPIWHIDPIGPMEPAPPEPRIPETRTRALFPLFARVIPPEPALSFPFDSAHGLSLSNGSVSSCKASSAFSPFRPFDRILCASAVHFFHFFLAIFPRGINDTQHESKHRLPPSRSGSQLDSWRLDIRRGRGARAATRGAGCN